MGDPENTLTMLFNDMLAEGMSEAALLLLEKVKDTYSQYSVWKAIFTYSLTTKG